MQAEEPVDDPGHDADGNRGDDGADKAVHLQALKHPTGRQQHYGCDDQVDDRAQPSTADGDAQDAQSNQ